MKSSQRKKSLIAASLFILFLLPSVAAGQHEEHKPPGDKNPEESEAAPEYAASGTSLEPRSAPHSMYHWRAGDWRLMLHANAFLVETQQSGPQGRDKLFGVNWMMVSLGRSLGPGNLDLRTMLSLEPASITNRRYPLLFQTGETAFGAPLINGQHPHEFVMELAGQYSLPLGENTTLLLYGGPVGEPALGPVAFPHRTSAAEIPEAPLGHHLQDSTHIATSVMTVGLAGRWWRVEASTFHGQEPDEQRWNVDLDAPDSWSARLTLRPGTNWVVQASHGHLNEPEELEEGDIDRTTASLAYNRPFPRGNWATTVVWGRNHKRATGGELNGYLLETSVQFRERNYVFARLENLDREGLFLTGSPENEPVTRVAALTFGAARDLLERHGFRLALGFNVSVYQIPDGLELIYGAQPVGVRLFLRLRLGRLMAPSHKHESDEMKGGRS